MPAGRPARDSAPTSGERRFADSAESPIFAAGFDPNPLSPTDLDNTSRAILGR